MAQKGKGAYQPQNETFFKLIQLIHHSVQLPAGRNILSIPSLQEVQKLNFLSALLNLRGQYLGKLFMDGSIRLWRLLVQTQKYSNPTAHWRIMLRIFLQTAGWSSSRCFDLFYNKAMESSNFALAVLHRDLSIS